MDDTVSQATEKSGTSDTYVSRTAFISGSLAALIPALTGAAYLTGSAYHQAYLETFKVPYGIINKSTTDYFLCAHRAAVGMLTAIVSTTVGAVVMFALFLSLFVWAVMSQLDKRLGRHPRVRNLRAKVRKSARLQILGEVFGLPAIFSVVFFYLLFILAFVLILPGVIGKWTGTRDAKSVQAGMRGGCEHPHNTGLHCTTVMREGRALARGFILDTSDKHVFLVEDGVTKVLPIADDSFVTVVTPTSVTPN